MTAAPSHLSSNSSASSASASSSSTVDSPAALGMPVRVSAVVRRFHQRSGAPVEVLAGIDLDVPASQFVALLGPSGCGKSTLLRLVAGLDTPDGGSLAVGGRAVRRREHLDAVAFVFQEAHLLPWRTLRKNVELPLELHGMPPHERRDRARHMLDRVGLGDAEERYPAQLSGGMQLRGSLARALVTEPRLLLLDEPFAALDEITRQRLDGLIHLLWRERRFTALFVTHSLREAVFLAERAVMFSRRPARIISDRAIEFSGYLGGEREGERGAELRASAGFTERVEQLYRDLLTAEGDGHHEGLRTAGAGG